MICVDFRNLNANFFVDFHIPRLKLTILLVLNYRFHRKKRITPGPWLLRISVVRFSLVLSFKKIQLYLAHADFYWIPSLVLEKSMSQIPNRHETKPSMYVLVDPGNPTWIRKPPLDPGTPPWLMLIFVFGSCLCTWLMLLYLAHAIVFGSC